MPPNLMPRRERGSVPRNVPEDAPPQGLFELSHTERHSELWRKLSKELTRRLEEQRKENDGPLDAEATARVRGHIQCLRSIIALGDDPPTFDE